MKVIHIAVTPDTDKSNGQLFALTNTGRIFVRSDDAEAPWREIRVPKEKGEIKLK